MAKRLVLATFCVAVIGAAVAAFAPGVTSCSSTSGEPERCTEVSTFEHDGAWVLVVVSFPVLLTALPLFIRHRITATASAAVLMTMAAARTSACSSRSPDEGKEEVDRQHGEEPVTGPQAIAPGSRSRRADRAPRSLPTLCSASRS